jgi:uncharacterized protein (UPF0332 family)
LWEVTPIFDDLEQAEKIERVTAAQEDVVRLHGVVDRDLGTAEGLQESNRDWSLAIAYNAMLQACHALMAAHGYRARGENQHRTTIEFAAAALPEAEELLDKLNRIRRRRHRAVYDVAGQVSSAEVEETLNLARKLVPILKEGARERLANTQSDP